MSDTSKMRAKDMKRFIFVKHALEVAATALAGDSDLAKDLLIISRHLPDGYRIERANR